MDTSGSNPSQRRRPTALAILCFASALAAAMSCSSIAAAQFTSPINLSPNIGGAEDHRVAASGTSVYVVWSADAPGNFDIFFRASPDGGDTWGAVLNLSANATVSRYPRIAVSGSHVLVVWGDYATNFTQQNILFRRSTDGGLTFQPVQQLSDSFGVFPEIAASGANVYAVWSTGSGGIFFRRSGDQGATFDDVQTFSANGTNPRLATNGSKLYVVWAGSLCAITLRRSADGGMTFGPTQQFPAGYDPRIAVNGENVVLAWSGSPAAGSSCPSNPRDIFSARSTDGGATFTSPLNLSSNSGSSELPESAVAGSNVAVVWMDDTTGSKNIFSRRSADGGATFADTQNLSSTSIAAWYPRVVMSDSDVYVVWQNHSPAGPVDVFVRHSGDGGATFNPAVNLSNNGGDGPEAAITSGSAYITWRHGSYIFFARATTSPPTPPTPLLPGAVIEGQTISIFTPTFQWTASSGAARYALSIRRYPYGSSDIVYSNTSLFGTSFTLPSGVLVNGERYRWDMTALNSAGESGVSNRLYFQLTLTGVPVLPAAPTAIAPGVGWTPGAAVDNLTPTFQWTPSSRATRYALYISGEPYGSSSVIYSSPSITTTSFTLPANVLALGTRYRWNVTASNSAGESGVSNTLYFAVRDPANVSPAAPTKLTTAWVTGHVNLAWTDTASNESGFKIERRDPSGGYAQIGVQGQNLNSYSDTTTATTAGYCYRVRATNAAGDSAYSNEACIAQLGPDTSAQHLQFSSASYSAPGTPGDVSITITRTEGRRERQQ